MSKEDLFRALEALDKNKVEEMLKADPAPINAEDNNITLWKLFEGYNITISGDDKLKMKEIALFLISKGVEVDDKLDKYLTLVGISLEEKEAAKAQKKAAEARAAALKEMSDKRKQRRQEEESELNEALRIVYDLPDDGNTAPAPTSTRQQVTFSLPSSRKPVVVATSRAPDPQPVKAVSPVVAVEELDSGVRNMLKVARELTGMAISETDSKTAALAKALKKLPTYEEFLRERTNNEAIFNDFYEANYGNHKSHIPSAEAIRREAAYLRFITQECAERHVIDPNSGISLEEWKLIDQQVLGDTGTNFSIPGLLGRRVNPTQPFDLAQTKYGALGGGLGDKMTRKEFDELNRLYLAESITKAELESEFAAADNIELKEGEWEFCDRSNPQQEKEISLRTAAREILEELGEGVALQYLYLNPERKSFAQIMHEALGLDLDLSDEAAAILEEQGRLIDKHSKKPGYGTINGSYHTHVNPLFAKFLKLTPEGRKMFEQVQRAADNATGCIVDDTTFPEMRLAAVKADPSKKENKGRVCLFPRSTCYVFDAKDVPMLSSLGREVAKIRYQNLERHKDQISEFKGLESYATPRDQLVDMLLKFAGDKFGYSHEAFAQIQAAAHALKPDDLAVVCEAVVGINKSKLVTKLRDLAEKANIVDLESGIRLYRAEDVAEYMLGKDLVRAMLPELAKAPADDITNEGVRVSSDEEHVVTSKEFKEHAQAAVAAARLQHQANPKVKSPIETFGCANLKEYVAFLRRATPAELNIAVGIESEDTIGDSKEPVIAIDGNLVAQAIEDAVSTGDITAKEKKKLMADKGFFHRFILELNGIQAQKQLEQERVQSREIKVPSKPLGGMFTTQSIGSDLSGVAVGCQYSERQGRRKSQEDSFAVGKARFGSDKALTVLSDEMERLGKKLAKEQSGTTAALVHVGKDKVTVAHIGDARVVAYVKRGDGTVTPFRLTADHGFVNPLDVALVAAHKDAKKSKDGFIFYRDEGGELRAGSLNMSRSFGDKGEPVLRQPSLCQLDVASLDLKDGDELCVVTSCDGHYEHVNEKYYAKALEEWSANPIIRENYGDNMALFLEDCAMFYSTDNLTTVVHKRKGADHEEDVLVVVADGHGGKEASSFVAADVADRLTTKEGRFVSLATDLHLEGYDPKKPIAIQVVKKTKAKIPVKDHEILGLTANPEPKDLVNAYTKLLELMDEKKPGYAEAASILSKAFLSEFIRSCNSRPSHALKVLQARGMEKLIDDAAGRCGEKSDGMMGPRAHFIMDSVEKIWDAGDELPMLEAAEAAIFHDKDGGKETRVVSDIISKYRVRIYSDDRRGFVERISDPNKVIHGGYPLVCYVARYGTDADMKDFLGGVKYDARKFFDINARDAERKTALLHAIHRGDVNKVAFLLAHGANPNATFVMSDKEYSLFELMRRAMKSDYPDSKSNFDLPESVARNEAIRVPMLQVLVQGGMKCDAGQLASVTDTRSANKMVRASNSYIVPQGLTNVETANVVARQILARKEAEDKLSYGNRKPARIVGVAVELGMNATIPDCHVPFRVVLAYQHATKLLDSGRSGEVTAARKVLAKSFLDQFMTARSHATNLTFPDVELVAEGQVRVEPAAQLLGYYSNFLKTVNDAYLLADDKRILDPRVQRQREAAASDNHRSMNHGFAEQLRKGDYAIVNFVDVFAKVQEVKTAFAAVENLKGEKTFYKVFERLSPDKSYVVTATQFVELMQEIPQTEEYKNSRQALARAFVAQFKDMDSNAICKKGVFDGLTNDQLASIKQSILSVGTELDAVTLQNVDYAVGLKIIMLKLESEQQSSNVEGFKIALSNYLALNGDISLLSDSLQKHPAVKACTGLKAIAGRAVEFTDVELPQKPTQQAEQPEPGATPTQLLDRLKSNPAKVIACAVLDINIKEFEEAKDPKSEKVPLAIVISAYGKEMDNVARLHVKGVNDADVANVRESLSGAFITLVAALGFDVSTDQNKEGHKLDTRKDLDLHYKILDARKHCTKPGVRVLGVLRIMDDRIKNEHITV